MGCGQKKLSVSVAVPPAPVPVPSQRPLAPNVASVTSVANEMIPGAEHLPFAEEIPGKPQLGDRLMKGLCDQSLPQMGAPFLQMRSVGSHYSSGREKKGKKERAWEG